MKKSLLVLSVLTALSMALVSCGGGAGGGDEPGKSDTPAPEKLDDFVAFEGSKVLEANGYDNYLDFAEPVNKAYKTVEVTYSWDSETGIQCQAQLMTADAKQASATMSSTTKNVEASPSAACFAGAEYDDWSTGSAVKTPCATSADRVQLFIQDSNYQPTTGTITVTKVVFKG